MKTQRKPARLLAVAMLSIGLLNFASTTSQAAGAAVYALKGKLSVTKSAWSVTGSLTRVNGMGPLPAVGSFSASGPVLCAGPQPEPPIRCQLTVSSGAFKIAWSNGATSSGAVTYTTAGAVQTLLARITAGTGKSGVIVYPWLANGGAVSSVGLVIGPLP